MGDVTEAAMETIVEAVAVQKRNEEAERSLRVSKDIQRHGNKLTANYQRTKMQKVASVTVEPCDRE